MLALCVCLQPESLDAWGEDEGDGAEEENGKKLPSVNASGGSRPGSAYMSPYSLRYWSL